MRGRGPDKHRCPVRRRVRRTSSDKYLAAFVRGPGLLAAQNGLLPATESLVGPVYAPCPAAGSLFAFQQLLGRSFYPTQTRLRLLGVIHPTNELVSPERG